MVATESEEWKGKHKGAGIGWKKGRARQCGPKSSLSSSASVTVSLVINIIGRDADCLFQHILCNNTCFRHKRGRARVVVRLSLSVSNAEESAAESIKVTVLSSPKSCWQPVMEESNV